MKRNQLAKNENYRNFTPRQNTNILMASHNLHRNFAGTSKIIHDTYEQMTQKSPAF